MKASSTPLPLIIPQGTFFVPLGPASSRLFLPFVREALLLFTLLAFVVKGCSISPVCVFLASPFFVTYGDDFSKKNTTPKYHSSTEAHGQDAFINLYGAAIAPRNYNFP